MLLRYKANSLAGPEQGVAHVPHYYYVIFVNRKDPCPYTHAAVAAAQIPVYVWAPEEEGHYQPGRCSRWWLHQSLKAFEADLRALGTSMVYRRSNESRSGARAAGAGDRRAGVGRPLAAPHCMTAGCRMHAVLPAGVDAPLIGSCSSFLAVCRDVTRHAVVRGGPSATGPSQEVPLPLRCRAVWWFQCRVSTCCRARRLFSLCCSVSKAALQASLCIRFSRAFEDESLPLCPQALIFNHLYDPISLVRDNEVKAAMMGLGVHCQSFNGDVLYEPWEVLGEGGRPLTSFDTFWGRCARAVCLSCSRCGLHFLLAEQQCWRRLAQSCRIAPGLLPLHGCHWQQGPCCQGLRDYCLSGAVRSTEQVLAHHLASVAGALNACFCAVCRVLKMPYPPPIPLPVPSALAPLPGACVSLDLEALGLMTAEEQQSNQQLYHCVRLLKSSLNRLPKTSPAY